MPVDIRPCRIEDLTALQALYRQLHAHDTTTLEELRQVLEALPEHRGCDLYVVEDDGEVVGTFILYFLPNLTHNGRMAAVMENVVVDATCRGKGIGRLMVEFAREQAIARNCYKLALSSNAVRTDAHEFYRRCGMIQHGLSFRYVL